MKTVFIDTNAIDDPNSFTHIFGHRSELERLSHSYRIMIPETVFDELMTHKSEKLDAAKEYVRHSQVLRRAGFDSRSMEDLSFDTLREEIIDGETIEYEIARRESPEVFMQKFYGRVLSHEPPFYEKTDRGFKDACVASSVDRYLSENPDSVPVYLLTDDERFAKYFDDNANVQVASSFTELVEENISISDEQVAGAEPTAECTTVAISDKERYTVESLVTELTDSPTYKATHEIIERLEPYEEKISNDQKKMLLKAAVENNQIFALLRDEDVHAFFMPIFDAVQDSLTDLQYSTFVDYAGLTLDHVDSTGNVSFSSYEKKAYMGFVDRFIDSIAMRHYASHIKSDADSVLSALSDYIAMVTLDPQLLCWSAIYDIFIDGEVTPATCECVSVEALQSFANLLRRGSNKKRDLVMQMLATRFDLIEDNLPF